MKPFIQITRHLYEEPHHLNLVVIASNGRAMGSLEFYLNPDSLREMGEQLSAFPKYEKSNYLFERGKERPEDNHAWYFRFRAYAKGRLDECGIQIRLNNNEKHRTYRERPENVGSPLPPQLTDFCIDMDAGSIRRLGKLLIEFSDLEQDRLYWTLDSGYLDSVVSQPPEYRGHVEPEAFAVLPK